MKTIPRLVVLAIVALCGVALIAQDAARPSKPKAAKPKEAAGMSMPMPKPSPEMAKMIKAMSGNWKVVEKHEPDPMMPNGATGEGTAKLWAGPGGLSMMENYHTAGAMGSFSGFGTFWWDAKAQVYRGVWCDSMTPNGCDTAGTSKWEGDKLIGMMESEMGGQKMTMKFIYSDFKPDSFTMTMEMGPDASSLKKAMTINYTKAAAPAKM